MKIEWLHKNQLIDFEAEPRFVQTNDHSLTITKAIELDSGIFTCRAKTELDQDTAQAYLAVQGLYNELSCLCVMISRNIFFYIYFQTSLTLLN